MPQIPQEPTTIELLTSICTRVYFLKDKIARAVENNCIDYHSAYIMASDLSIANAQMQAVVNRLQKLEPTKEQEQELKARQEKFHE
jgi:hypothetical protein